MTLSASIEVLQARRDEMPERAVAALDLLVADVARFQNLVEDLLEISRFDAGAIRLHREELLVAEFVRQAVSVSSARDAPVKVSERAENLVIRGDKRRLARVMANLIDNARHPRRQATTTSRSRWATRHRARASRSATCGSPCPTTAPASRVEERALVFERFARGAVPVAATSSEGAGLGLALVDEHVRLQGGRVWVEERADGEPGARFVIELPAEEA